MRIPRALLSSSILWLALAAAPASAQQGDPIAPVQCYQVADDRGLSSANAQFLCAGATSDAPARCLALAQERGELSDQQALQLCRFASSPNPAICASRLSETTTLSNDDIIYACTETRLIPYVRTFASDPSCIEAAVEYPDIPSQLAVRLCSGADSAAPLACYVDANNTTGLTNDQIVDLCAPINLQVIPPAY